MIADEIIDFKRKINAGESDSAALPTVPKPNAPYDDGLYFLIFFRLVGPTRNPMDETERDDQDDSNSGPMDIDEELRMKGH